MERLRYILGLVTLAAAMAGAWFLFDLLSEEEGAESYRLRLEYQSARGLRTGADVRLRGVPVGTVRRVRVSDDGGRAVVEISLEAWAEAYARVNSRFWIVAPRFSGLMSGASGLDTLVRDAYVAFVTPDPGGPQLPAGSLLAGLEQPDPQGEETGLDPIQRGDLVMSLLMPENHGLSQGARVMFRGMKTGDVRAVDMAPDGSFVQIQLRIHRAYRHTVTDESRFWIARPRLSGALFSGIALQDLNAFLSPFVSYYGDPGVGLPVEDGYRALGSAERPDVEVAMVPDAALESGGIPKPVGDNSDTLHLVRVVYKAVEVDFLSANDEIQRDGTGVLFADRSGRTVVLTARSVCDAFYFVSDGISGDPDVESEEIRVLLAEGPVFRAGRIWVDPGGRDVALLVLEEASPNLAVTPAGRLGFPELIEQSEGELLIQTADAPTGAAADPVALTADLPELETHRGAVILRGGLVVGVLGQRDGANQEPVIVPAALLPEALRPRR